MKLNFTHVFSLALIGVFSLPVLSWAQYNPGLPARFGIDGDNQSGQSMNITGNSPSGSFDWVKKSGNNANAGIGVIDTSNTSNYKSQIAAGQNITFSKGMAFSRYSAQGGYLLLDARYGRDNFGLSNSGGQDDKTTYTSGSKNGDIPTTWITTPNGATVGDKADIIDTYIHMRRDGTTINNTNPSHLILAMGVNTIGNTGNRYVDFELFRSRIEYNSTTGNFSNSGPIATGGHSAWTFNSNGTVKEIGDLSVSYSYSTAGVDEISVYIWVSNSIYNSVQPALFNFVPNNFFGSSYGYAKITSLAPNGFQAWGSASTSSTNAAPWGTTSKTEGASSSQFNYAATKYAAYDFGEVALDLTTLGIDPALSVGMNPCSPPFTRVMAKTRSSSTFESALQDFTGPYEFLDAPQAPAQIVSPASLRCNLPTVTLSPAIIISGAVYNWTTTDGNILSNPNATTITVNKTGKYYLTAAIVAGCPTNIDSTIVNSDYYKPVASASVIGMLDPLDEYSFVNIQGGDVAASNYNTPYGGSAGLTWKWTGPNGFTANTRNTWTTQEGTYMLELTESRNGCKDTAETLVQTAVILPLKLSNFNAAVSDKIIMLNWNTEQEINHNYFELERSFDGRNFKNIAILFGAESVSGSVKTYGFKDNSIELLNNSIVYYRLKQVDNNDKYTYSSIIAVRMQSATNINVQVSPNPFIERIYLRFESTQKGNAEIKIVNITGQILMVNNSTVIKGYNNLQIEEGLSKLTSGIYLVQMSVNGVLIGNQKIIKQ